MIPARRAAVGPAAAAEPPLALARRPCECAGAGENHDARARFPTESESERESPVAHWPWAEPLGCPGWAESRPIRLEVA